MQVELPARIVFGLCALALASGIVQLMRHGQIKEKYALLWLPLGLAFSFFGIFPEALVRISALVGLHYITVVVLCVILAFTLILLYFTARLSQLREDVKRLGQEMALLRSQAGQRSADRGAPGRVAEGMADGTAGGFADGTAEEAPSSPGWTARPAEDPAVRGRDPGEERA